MGRNGTFLFARARCRTRGPTPRPLGTPKNRGVLIRCVVEDRCHSGIQQRLLPIVSPCCTSLLPLLQHEPSLQHLLNTSLLCCLCVNSSLLSCLCFNLSLLCSTCLNTSRLGCLCINSSLLGCLCLNTSLLCCLCFSASRRLCCLRLTMSLLRCNCLNTSPSVASTSTRAFSAST